MNLLTIYYSMTFHKYNGEYYCNGAFGRYLDELAKNIDKIILCVPVKEVKSSKYSDYKIISKNIKFQEMPDYKNVIGSVKYIIPSTIRLIRFSKEWRGQTYIRWPSPYSYIVYILSKFNKIETNIHIVGDSKAVVLNGSKYRGIIKSIAISYANLQDIMLRKMMKKSTNISNGTGMRRIYSDLKINVSEIRTSTIMKEDIYERKNIFNNCEKIKILYVGYLRQEKGVSYLLKAIKELENITDKRIELDIVGDGEEYEVLKKLSKDLGIENKVNFKGYIPLGKNLFDIYKENDIFILPSLSEGTPRVLIEAMANGLVVVATDVGGIPYTIKHNHNGILIKSASSNDISRNIKLIIENTEETNNIVENAYEFVKFNTLEAHCDEIIQIMEGKIKNDEKNC